MSEQGSLGLEAKLHPKYTGGKFQLTIADVRMNKMLTRLSSLELEEAMARGLTYRGERPVGWKPKLDSMGNRMFYLTKMWWRQWL